MGGPHFTYPCRLAKHGISIQLRSLIDTGANGFAFLNKPFAEKLQNFLGITPQRLLQPITIKGYDGKANNQITSYLSLSFIIDKRKMINMPFFLLELGNHDLILGRIWLEYFKVLPDVANKSLIWPKELPESSKPYYKEVILKRDQLVEKRPNRHHQKQAFERDQAMLRQEESNTISTISINTLTKERKKIQPKLQVNKTYKADYRQNIVTINRKLLGIPNSNSNSSSRSITRYKRPTLEPNSKISTSSFVNIYAISSKSFDLLLNRDKKKGDLEVFTTSLYEIDRIIAELSPEDKKEIEAKVPEYLLPYSEAFSKGESNKLPPHRSYDHRIVLDQPHDLKYSPLYNMSREELLLTKEYINNNLEKGFIEPSEAPYASPVLFVKKADGSLRFCIDFRKLNEITRKDRYLILLIDETLARIGKAKVFTKLDIRQAFHRIRMDPNSEELTTFRTRYGAYKCKVLPFGLTNGPATFQRHINNVLMDYLDVFCTAYLDDIIIYSEIPKEHHNHVTKVIRRLLDAGLQVDVKKSEFSVTRTKYLGFVITTDGIEVDQDKISVIRDWKYPTTVQGI